MHAVAQVQIPSLYLVNKFVKLWSQSVFLMSCVVYRSREIYMQLVVNSYGLKLK